MDLFDIAVARKLSSGGGGGSSDFSTAEVTINGKSGEYLYLLTDFDPISSENYVTGLYELNGHYAYEAYFSFDSDTTQTFNILKVDTAILIGGVSEYSTCTGDCVIAFDEDRGSYLATITGDCTITIS